MSSRRQGKVRVITGTGGSMGRASAPANAGEGALAVGCDLGLDAVDILVDGGMRVR